MIFVAEHVSPQKLKFWCICVSRCSAAPHGRRNKRINRVQAFLKGAQAFFHPLHIGKKNCDLGKLQSGKPTKICLRVVGDFQ